MTNAERDGQRVFAVGDLLEPHPTDKNRWKVFGRVDDQIALSTGQKVRSSHTLRPYLSKLTQHLFGRSTRFPMVRHLEHQFRDVLLT